MTENEAIKGLETLKYQCKHNGECGTCNICCSAIPIAIQALEEIQQYRAIGTIEEFNALKEKNVEKKIRYEHYCGFRDAECPVCGKGIDNKDEYCSRCGQKLDRQRKEKL